MRITSLSIIHRIASFALTLGLAMPVMAAPDAGHLSAFTERGMGLWHVPGMSVAYPVCNCLHNQGDGCYRYPDVG